MILYGRRNSSNTAKVLWALAELGCDFELRETGGSFGGTDTPEYRAMHPHGKVPCLAVAGGAVWESHAILRFLGAAHPGPLWPQAPLDRARVDSWMDWTATALVPPLGRYRKSSDAEKATFFQPVAKAFQALDAKLSDTDYIAGPTLSFADIAMAPSVHRWHLIAADRPALPRLDAYRERLRTHDNYRSMIEDALS